MLSFFLEWNDFGLSQTSHILLTKLCHGFTSHNYIVCRANDICKESKRQTISADDVLKAIEEIEFPEFIEPLKASLDGQYLVSFAHFHPFLSCQKV